MAAFHYPDLVTAASASASSAVPEGVHERATEPKLVAPARNIRLIYGNVQKSFCQVHRPSLLLSVARCYIFYHSLQIRRSGNSSSSAAIGANNIAISQQPAAVSSFTAEL